MATARHPKATFFVRGQLFSGLTSFAELESKIAALPDEKSRGDAFEVFAEAYLATQRKYDAAQVWPHDSVPLDILKNLGLSQQDRGVDGVLQTLLGQFDAYQVKFRTGRPSLTWRELSTFFGLTDSARIHSRVVFTNCDEFPDDLKDRRGFFCIRGSDLDRLEATDFRTIEAWLADAVFIAPKKSPDKDHIHQAEALNALVSALQTQPRVSAIMACGTGKTLVALWVAERLEAKRILVLLPSLALLRQTLHEWVRETNLPPWPWLCVCSDLTVKEGIDPLVTQQSDLDFQVTTDSASVRSFLDSPFAGVKMIFSTYQSASVVGAAMQPGEAFDFAVFDEAHKTAGREGRNFAFALDDKNLPIRKRLFLTATPRHYNPLAKSKDGGAQLVFSMDKRETYGPIVYRLPFSEAAKRGIISDYKVIISEVTSDMVNDELIRRGITLVKGEEIKTRQVANQIALKSAIEKYNVSKVFTFHSRVDAAKSFTSDGAAGISNHLQGFHCGHIEGAMPTAYRERVMRVFKSAPHAILSNARCLTEGVDVPAVDMVAFLAPRRSMVDIVQATGRAMRRSPGKQFGYVLVPLYVEKTRGETVEQAVLRSNFDEIWKVLQALKEQDDLLSQIIDDMRIQRGRTGGFDESRFRERVEMIGPEISLDSLRQSITAACIEAIGEQWFERYGQLYDYKQKHGSCDMPARWDENQRLATWVVDQRVRKRDGNLEPEKIELLNRLSFNWNPRETNWRGMYLEMVKFQKRFGHCRVPQNWSEDKSLSHWVKTQRQDYAEGDLHHDRIALLEKIRFEWLVDRGTWDNQFNDLCAFKVRFGHTRVSVKWAENPLLGRWVVRQRYQYNKKKLAEDLIQRLNSIGFEWDGRIAAKPRQKAVTDPNKHWREVFELFKAYASANGADVVTTVDAETKKLKRWMLYQRQAKNRGELSEARINALNEIGFVWQRNARRTGTHSQLPPADETPITRTWDEMLSELVDFFKLHGHCNVPDDWTAKPELARWVAVQRRSKKQNQLTPEQVSQMEEIGFAWSTHDGGWDAMFAKLVEHMRPMHNGKRRDAPASDELKRWMLTQRQAKKRGDLEPEREKRLTSIGFEWEPYASRWEKMFDALRQFHADHGDCRVSAGWSENPVLANWVGVQRARKLDGKLSPERIAALDALGFAWRLGEFSGTRSPQEAWKTMLKRLTAFHAEHKHAAVPQVYPSDKKLGWWVTTQRRKYRKQKLADWQIARLNELSFDWGGGRKGGRPRTNIPKPLSGEKPLTGEKYFETMFQALIEYKQEHGDCLVPQRFRENRKLAEWVSEQRMAYNREGLAPERVRRLCEIGFEWDPVNTRWEEMFQQLVEFKKEHNHTNVPQRSGKYKELGTWVRNQRGAKRDKRPIMVERAKRLDEIGFVWQLVERNAWERMLERLVEFKKIHGHCNVPQKAGENKRLGKWVNSQRTANFRGKITPTRKQQLDSIGFVWNLRPNLPAAR